MNFVPELEWHYSEIEDTNDGKEWSLMDIVDLRAALKQGGTIESAAAQLCRSGTQDDVRRKAVELGLI